MPYPQEYQLATMKFHDFLSDVSANAGFTSTHMAYTMTQGVLQVFRRRLSLEDAIRFSNILPAGIRALFVADWDPAEEQQDFHDRASMLREAGQLRSQHNFSFMVEDSIAEVANALRNHVDEHALDTVLSGFPEGALEFWHAA